MFLHASTWLLAIKFAFKNGPRRHQVHLLASGGRSVFWQGLAPICNRLQFLKKRFYPCPMPRREERFTFPRKIALSFGMNELLPLILSLTSSHFFVLGGVA
jgi:hypothetical protein